MWVVLLGADWPTTKIDMVKWLASEPMRLDAPLALQPASVQSLSRCVK